MPDPKVIQIGNDPSPAWNDVRRWLADHYNNAEVMEALKAEELGAEAAAVSRGDGLM